MNTIKTVSDLGTHYLVNDSMFVPKDEKNPDYQTIQDWNRAGKPSMEETKSIVTNIKNYIKHSLGVLNG